MDLTIFMEKAKLADKLPELANQYAQALSDSEQAKNEIEIRLAGEIDLIRGEKSNVGYDMAIIMLLNSNPELAEVYKEWKKKSSVCKKLDKIIETNKSTLSYYQSLMKYIEKGEQGI